MNQNGVFHPRLWEELRGVQGYALPDSCKILVYSASADAYGHDSVTYTPGSEISCRFNVKLDSATAGREVLGSTKVPENSTFLALPINVTTEAIVAKDRIRITQRQGAAISPELDYEIESPVIRGTANIFFRLMPVDE